MIGSVLDKYEVMQKIGEGGMATVYRGRHAALSRDVAIKVLHPHLSSSERNRERFAREARAIAQLDHDNILKIFDYSGIENDECYIVTELVEGATLQALIAEQGKLPSELVLLIALQLVSALGYAHSLGIVHRDLKPENVMVRRDGAVKLMDFGIARFLDEVNLTMTGALVGSPAYMSPEQALERPVDPRSDLFSLGTLLFQAISGQLPFSGSNPSLILRNIIEGNRPEVLEVCPEANGGLADLIERLLQVEQKDRPADCAAVLPQVQAALAAVEVDPKDPAWSISAWLLDPAGVGERLKAHLRELLLRQGRERLAANEHLSALRAFNRLLSIDEDNAEVLHLVQSMHTIGAVEPRPRPPLPWVAGAVALAMGAGLAYLLWPAPPRGLSGAEAVAESPIETPLVVEEPGEDPGEEPALPPTPAPTPGPAPVEAKASKVTPSKAPPPRPTTGPGPADAAARPTAPGRITVVVPGSWGNIWVDDKLLGRTGEVGAMEVSPGRHTLRVENDLSLAWERPFEIAPGEQLDFSPPLLPKPALALLPPGLDPACTVTVDGANRGPVSANSEGLTIRDPRTVHSIRVTCPDGDERSARLEPVRPGSVFTVPLR
jgi:serine/threonine-protein kinase